MDGSSRSRDADLTRIADLEGEVAILESVLLRLAGFLADFDHDRIVVELTDAAREVTGADFGLYAAIDDQPEVRLVGVDHEAFEEMPSPHHAPLLAAALASGQPLRIDDVARWAPSDESARPYGSFADGRMVRSYLAAPVRSSNGELLGSMVVGHHHPRAFDRRQERRLTGLCEHLAVALESARRFRERAEVARALQETLLPPLLPAIRGVELAARYRATGAGNLVGGDFYDVFETGDGTWAVVLGDVSGFGPEAAALTGLARYTVRAVAAEQSPREVLHILNRALYAERDSERFCTAVFLRFGVTPAGIDVCISIGGHPPPIVLRDDGSTETVKASSGLLLGLFPDADPDEADLQLHPGDAIVLFTDGVIEARRPDGEQFGQERLHELLARSAGRTADGVARRVDVAVMDFQGGSAHDDVAVVVLRAAPAGDTGSLG